MESAAAADGLNPTITLETVTSSDADALASLRVEAMRESLERLGRFDPERARARFLGTFSPEWTRAIVEDGQRVGFVVVRPRPDGLLLDHLYVRPSHQNRRIGAAVLRAVFAEADAQRLCIRVGALRGSDSNRFYSAHGFELVEQAEFDNYYVRRPQHANASIPRIERVDHTASDIARRLHEVQMVAYAQEARLLGIARFPPLERTLEDLQSSAQAFLAAFIGNELVGALGTSRDRQGTSTHIDSLVVAPAFQRRGIARALLVAIIDARGTGELTVQTAAQNTPALALYAQAGFVEVDRWRVDDGSLELVRLRRSRKLAERSTALIDRPIQTVRVEPVASLPNDAWLQLRLALWPHCGAQEHLDEMAAFVAEPRRYAQFIAYDGAQAVGLAEAAVRHDYVNGAETSPVAFLEGLYVVPAARRNGIGGRLVAAVAAWARDQGIRELASDTAIDNLASHAMHKALGFEETERVVFFRMVLDNPAS